MLIIEARVGDKRIEEICIQNSGNIDKAGRHIYRVYPGCNKDSKLKREFHHRREGGWKPLALQVLKHLISLEQ